VLARRVLAANLVLAKPADNSEQKATRTRISRKMEKTIMVFWFFGLLCRHTASELFTSDTHTIIRRHSPKCRKSGNLQNKEQQTKKHKTRIAQRSRQKKRKLEEQTRKTRQNGRKMTSFRGAIAKLAACVDNELGGSPPHQCR